MYRYVSYAKAEKLSLEFQYGRVAITDSQAVFSVA